ncbi:MAG: VanW family protein [Actinomycetota bacterium]|nr:VanW family protein [Actinomycetota bacterium]
MVRRAVPWALLVVDVLVGAALVLGFSFAGSESQLAAGVTIAGVDVGGLSPAAAERLLERRAAAVTNMPVVFVSGDRRFAVRPSRLGVEADWGAAVDEALREGSGFTPLRGLRRLRLRLFGEDVTPSARAWEDAVAHRLSVFARAVDRPHRDSSVVYRGLRVVVLPGYDGRVLDRRGAAPLLVRSLASFSRRPVPLPIRADPQTVTVDDLGHAAEQAKVAVSAPVRLAFARKRWRIARWRISTLLELPKDGSRTLRIGGPDADAFFRRLTDRVDRPPRNADFAITTTGVRVVPARKGVVVDVPATAARLLAAVVSPTDRLAELAAVTKVPARSTEEARAMGITDLVRSYETTYGGDPNRIHNVQLVARLIDRTLVAPGKTFSFNRRTGERTPEKGFRSAPVIINGDLQSGIGGGVCQVSTTVFNAAYDAGLEITARTNHALYISHYPQGRDATVNYPDIDLRFVNDTDHWLLLRTFVGPSSLTVALYGTPVNRRVETQTSPLVETGEVPITRVADPNLYEGEEVTDEYGTPPQATSVHRRVFDYRGRLLHDDTWSSSYAAEPTVIRYGTKPRPKPEPKETPEPTAPSTGAPAGAATSGTETQTQPSPTATAEPTAEQDGTGVTPP